MGVSPPRLDQPLSVPGFRLGVASCGVKSPEETGKRNDIMLLISDVDCHAAGVFTQNRMRAACVTLGESTLQTSESSIRAIVANSGNANAGTGEMERIWAQGLIETAAQTAGIKVNQTLSASTGVIGQPFPIERIRAGMQKAAASLSPDGWEQAAGAIRTTDTFAKWASRRVGDYTITGICKGSGMIHPDMATMLAFIATDAPLSANRLQAMLKRAVDRSFNSISVDGDTSTNDTVYLLASGLGLGHPPLENSSAFEDALTALCIELAQLIVRDGEGVSKFVTIHVTGAMTEAEARQLGRAIAVSPLVKTAFAGSDANWGRILMAIGNSGVDIDPDAITLKADDITILAGGNLHPDYRDDDGMAVFAKDEFTLHVDLGIGSSSATIWTGDLTHEYIKINAEYRT
jgi:glutamate N-acetyltransferase/amino-acid N-acetyltransferase